jgi:Cdc6-like AAA superfamily ATPase
MRLLQLVTLNRLFSRKFASNASAAAAAVSNNNLKGGGNKKNTTKSITTETSKMPQPHPVLTPLARTSADQLTVDQLPAIEAIESCEKFIHRIELGNELQKRLTKGLGEVSDRFGGNLFILRKELIKQVGEALKESDHILIDGPNGSGKSVLLMQIYSAMKESIKNYDKKVILYAPNVHKWTTGYFAYYPIEQAGQYKQPELALEILRLLMICNPMEKLPSGLTEQFNEAKLDAFNRAIPLYEKTMNELLKDKEFYLFLDGVNGLIDENSLTGYTDNEGNALPLKSLPLCNDFFFKSIKNKRVIGATTKSNPDLPRVIQQTSFKSVINVPNYSVDELKKILQLYGQLGHCSTNKSEQFVAFKAFVSASNGRKLYKSCEYDSIYFK